MNAQQHFLKLPESLFETSAVADFTGDIALDDIIMGADRYSFPEPVHYQLIVTNTGGAFLVTGSLGARALSACARCLDDVELDIDAEVEAYYLIPDVEASFTEDEEVEYEILEGKDKIDLDALVRSALALAFPYIPLCKDDCAGLCSQCGANLNHETCDCVIEHDDHPHNPFAVLKDLKLDTD
jgi:uncharacterized protein